MRVAKWFASLALLAAIDVVSHPALGSSPHVTAVGFSFTDVCPTGGPGSGDGVIDPGEIVGVRVTLQNDGDTDLTNISGTLSTTAPGVSVPDDSGVWEDLDPGASTLQLDDFNLAISTSVSCGTSIATRLHAFYDQGANLTGILVETGTPTQMGYVCNPCAEGSGGPPPGEAGVREPLLVSRSGGNVVFTWAAPVPECSGVHYSLYRGSLDTLRSTGYAHDTSLTCEALSATFSLPDGHPLLGDSVYYLVVAHTTAAEGSYGRDSAGFERPPSNAACKPVQDLSSCAP